MKKLFGFTLAEVLITLGIIGVVAAMTIPTLMKNYRRHLVETRVKHTYATIAQVFRQATVDYGEMDGWGWDYDSVSGNVDEKEDNIYNFVSTYMLPYMSGATISKKMTLAEFGYKAGMKSPKGATNDSRFTKNKSYYFISLNNGVVIIPFLGSAGNGSSKKLFAITFLFDIDGVSGLNTHGKDIFRMSLIPSSGQLEMTGETLTFSVATGLPAEKGTRSTILKYCKTTAPWYCSALIKLDGWKISNDYPWL